MLCLAPVVEPSFRRNSCRYSSKIRFIVHKMILKIFNVSPTVYINFKRANAQFFRRPSFGNLVDIHNVHLETPQTNAPIIKSRQFNEYYKNTSNYQENLNIPTSTTSRFVCSDKSPATDQGLSPNYGLIIPQYILTANFENQPILRKLCNMI